MAIKPVEIVIKADDKATPEIKNVVKAVDAIDPAAKRAGASSDASLGGMQQRGLKAADGIKSISEQLALVQKAFVLFQGGDFLTSLIKDTAQTADEYANLAARIKLATGEGELFDQAMGRVQQIALDTNSALQGTGNLFARLTDAGKNAGLSAEVAVSQALDLTESINQAVQLSGSSAQASDAALTQLIQGLQSGVLRGEEFNSVMEQSPRLARALADGLGVTTGELRKMANEGRLTSEVVIGALKSQADTLKSEFETLPPTVGRAVQNLATSWTIYVGEADKATGASQLAANAIDALAKNLDTVAGYLLDAGQAAAAFAALRLAQTFLGIGAAATASATAIAANTVAMTAAGTASTAAAASVGRFATILAGLKTFTLLGLVTNFQDIGTWIGEGIAKLQGYKDKTDELAQAERSRVMVAEEQRKIVEAQAAANRAAADAQFELSKAAQSSLGVFDDLVAKGKTAGEAVAEIGKDFDLASLPGIANAAAVLDKLAADGKISADQFKQAWADALKGEDLQVFEVNARAALAGTARESERLAAIMDGTLREAIRRSGGDFDVLAGGMSKAARSAINDTDTIINGLDRLKTQGVDVGKALELSLNKAIKTADSQAAIEALRARVEQVRKLLGDQVADGLLKAIEEQAKKALGSVTELDKALKLLGVKTREDLKQAAEELKKAFETARNSGKLSADQLAEAFKKYAEAAIAANGGVASELIKSQAETYGLEIAVDKTGKAIVRAMGEGKNATNEFGKGMRDAAAEVQGVIGWLDRLEKRNAAVKSSLSTDDQGFAADASGKRIAAGGDLTTLTGIANFLQSAGLDQEQARELALEFSDGKGNIPYLSNAGQIKYGGRSSTMSEALLKAAERTTFAGVSTGSAEPTTGASRTVRVELNTGRGVEVVNTDDAGAAAIVRALQSARLSAGS
jgi:tape measure domain-containing protein